MAATLPTLCLQVIFDELLIHSQNEIGSPLYSCILVNRHWYLSTIPELYKNPFEICNRFDSPRVKNRNDETNELYISVDIWCKSNKISLFGLAYNSFCKHFISNCLHIFKLDISNSRQLSNIFEFPGATKCLSSIKILRYGDNHNLLGNYIPKQIDLISKNICRFELYMPGNYPTLKDLEELIKSQKKITEMELILFEKSTFNKLIDILINTEHKNTIENFEFYKIDLTTGMSINSSLIEQLALFKNLKYLKFDEYINDDELTFRELVELFINYCGNLVELEISIDLEEFEEMIKLLKVCKKLKSLYVYDKLLERFEELIIYRDLDISQILPEIGQVMPSEMKRFDIDINLKFTHEALKEFLVNCKVNYKKLNLELWHVQKLTDIDRDLLNKYGIKINEKIERNI
ncbi:11284_t:CDS:2 [Diversispora eburnea]|uniref:11284_t:CDS:1 n=1 Tax=Diversispora eburnea TaxID=1213867 RepID=A0A9N8W9M9_9GLOM|nr:11284_t:CDS:2 [Diversispora eburnea]